MPTHHLYTFGHNPHHKLLPHPNLAPTVITEPTDVLHPHWRALAKKTYGVEELAGEYVWGDFGSTIIRLFDGDNKSGCQQYILLGYPPDELLPEYVSKTNEWDIPSERPGEVSAQGSAHATASTTAPTASKKLGVSEASRIRSETVTSSESSPHATTTLPLDTSSLADQTSDVKSFDDHHLLDDSPDQLLDDDPDHLLDDNDSLLDDNDHLLKDDHPLPNNNNANPSSSRSYVTPLANLPHRIKIIGYERLEGYLDMDTGRVKRLVRSSDQNKGRAAQRETEEDEADTDRNNEDEERDEETGDELRWRDIVSLSDGTIYGLPISEPQVDPTCPSSPGLYVFPTFTALLQLRPSDHIPLPLPPGTKSAGISLQGGTSHILIHAREPSSMIFGLGDNRYQSATPFPLSLSLSTSGLPTGSKPKRRPGQASRPEEIEPLSGVPIRQVTAGESVSGAVSAMGEAWIWGKGVGVGTLQRVGFGDGRGLKEGGEKAQHEDIADEDQDDNEEEVKFLALGEGYGMVVLEDDQVYVRGQNDYGQLGLPPRSTNIDVFETDPDPQYPEWTAHPFFAANELRVEAVCTKDWASWVQCVEK
ncbi:hypothetical protein HD553DRAFT_312330 [Filobasidium floriforme]|uniref:uncharacterized protein n=1 Tax=Filobasidium floriforme TaxID=5210 RepID=UPI001E8E173C|nr:uncharacterized protein HD553DRAFT_312330 [Filobasidium floriforme]KAH8084200.1 hypothetical protein HD553DRAFT_312330 [Filobasidium floriforme]